MATKEDILLAEYQTCQSHNDSIGQQSWTSYGIVFSGSTILLAVLAYNIVTATKPIELQLALLVLAITVMFFCFCCL